MRDLEKLRAIFDRLPVPQESLIEIEQLVGAVQNPPPEGEADGTINEALWQAAKGAAATLRSYDYAIRILAAALKK